jgi:[protein-PII] uridylyltransferase
MRTTEQFGGNEVVKQKQNTQTVELNKELLRNKIKGVSKEEVEAHCSMLPERYFINTESSEIQLHLQMVNHLFTHIQITDSMASLAPIIVWRNDIDLNMTIVNIVTWDRSGLFYKQAGALTLAGVNIVSTKAVSRKDHISINTFYVLDPEGGVVCDPESKGIFERRLSEALIDNKEHMPEISKLEAKKLAITRKDMLPAPFPPSVDVYHELSLKQTIVEVQASDRIGLLYQISRRITEEHFDISFARIATERGVAMDTFYIKNENPKKETDTATLLELRNGLDKIVRELPVE